MFRVRKIFIISILFFHFSAFCDTDTAPHFEIKRQDEIKFIRALILNIRSELRTGILFSNFYSACATEDQQWWVNQTGLDRSMTQKFCKNRYSMLRRKIKTHLPKLRLLMGLAQYQPPGEVSSYFLDLKRQGKKYPLQDLVHYRSSNPAPNFFRDLPESNEEYPQFDPNRDVNSYPVSQSIAFKFSNSIRIPPLSPQEMYQAEKILYHDLIIRRKFRLGQELSEEEISQAVCAFDSHENYIRAGDKCYKKAYQALIFGDPSIQKFSLPLLAYLPNQEPSVAEFTGAIDRIESNALDLLDDLEKDYFVVSEDGEAVLRDDVDYTINSNLYLFAFYEVVKRTVDGAKEQEEVGHSSWEPGTFDKWKHLAIFGLNRLKTWEMNKLILQVTGMVAVGVTCSRLPGGELLRAICLLPLGLGGNTYFYHVDSQNYNEAVKIALYRPNGVVDMGYNVNRLSNLEFSQRISFAMLPFFTGIGNLNRALKVQRAKKAIINSN